MNMFKELLRQLSIVFLIFIAFVISISVFMMSAFYILVQPMNDYKKNNVEYYSTDIVPELVSIDELIRAYEYDPSKANDNYAGKFLIVRGTFKKALVDGEYISVGPQGNWTINELLCEIKNPEFRHTLRLSSGDLVFVSGFLSGGDNWLNVRLESATFVSGDKKRDSKSFNKNNKTEKKERAVQSESEESLSGSEELEENIANVDDK